MPTRAYRIAYDGRPYYGFQRQPSVPTVEGALLSALVDLGIAGDRDGEADGVGDDGEGDTPDPPPGYAAAGRTDRGVSALAQTVAFDAPEWATPRALNGELPADVRAWAAADAPEGFHATRDAAWRAYRYHLHAPDLDADGVARALSGLEGTHDFHNLTAVSDPGVDTTRTVREATVERAGPVLRVDVRADGFLHETVRRIVSLVAGVARGDATVTVERALSAERLSGPEGIAPAPPEPLVLTGVGYPGLDFAVDGRAAESARSVFEERRRRARTRARTMGSIADGAGGDRGG
jgi:tRNA pseudouridine38-40 synthase